MPQELDSNYPHVTPEEWAGMEAPREVLAARLAMSRYVTGIPRRGFLTGSADAAPVSKGVQELAAAAYVLLDAMDDNLTEHDEPTKAAMDNLTRIMETFDVRA